jgi:SAM-dependent methyltransferase
LVFLGNPPDETQLYEEDYGGADPEAEAYRAGSSHKHMAELYSINQQRLACLRSLKPHARLLDIGCGRGHFIKLAHETGYDAQGIDVSARAIGYAREQFGLRAEVRRLEEIVEAGEQFDLITLWHVLEHFADPYAALRQIRSLLRRDGLCVIEVPNLRSLKFMLSKSKWNGGNHPFYHRTFFTGRTLKDAFTRTGFSGARRLRLSYRIPGRSRLYDSSKRFFNLLALDAFLDMAAWK